MSKTAVLLIDLQKEVLDPKGTLCGDLPVALFPPSLVSNSQQPCRAKFAADHSASSRVNSSGLRLGLILHCGRSFGLTHLDGSNNESQLNFFESVGLYSSVLGSSNSVAVDQ